MLVMLVELSISTRTVVVGDGHGAESIASMYSHPSQLNEIKGKAVLSALFRAVPVIFPVLDMAPSLGEDSSWTC